MIDYENLQLYLRLGSKPKKIHCILELNQSRWLKQHVELNTQKRIEAEKKWLPRWKSVEQINEQCCIWKSKGKLKNDNWCNTCKEQKRPRWKST